jgi:hypothetical protein
MTPHTLSDRQVNDFIVNGYLVVENGFNPKQYWHWVEQALSNEDPPIALKDPSTWHAVFQRPSRPGVFNASSGHQLDCKQAVPAIWGALSDLLGTDRIVEPFNWNGEFSINLDRYPGEEWIEPGPRARGWHLDWWDLTGYLDNCWPSILVFAYWNDIEPKGGGTFLCPDSLKHVARRLRDHPEGLNKYGELADGSTWRNDLPACENFLEIVAKAGTVAFVNGMMLHAASANKTGKARVMSRSIARLKDVPDLNRSDAAQFSPYEFNLLHALGEEKLDFQRVVPDRFQESKFKDGKSIGIVDTAVVR